MPTQAGRGRKPATTPPRPLSIGALARATGIPAPTLRTWERRYGWPEPERKPSGHRVYPARIVGRLRKVARLLGRGHRPADVLTLATADLDALLVLPGPAATVAATPPRHVPSTATADPALEEMLQAVVAFDRQALTGLLREGWIRLGPLSFLEGQAADLMREVGSAWHSGRFGVRHEHFASACLAGFLREVREPLDRQARGPRVVAAMLPGDAHEGGLLMASVVLALRGCRLVYLGADTPIEQIACAAREGEAAAVAVSVSAAFPVRRARRELAALQGALPRRVLLWTGGAGAPGTPRGVERFESLEALDRHLAAWVQS